MKTPSYLLVACTGLGALSLPLHGVTVPLTGGDAGQGLTVDTANFVKGLDLAGGTAKTIQTASFSAMPNAGFTVGAPAGASGPFTGAFAFGASETSANDTATAALMSSIFFGANGVNVTINSLTPGSVYQLDLIQSVTSSYVSREQAILVNGVWQENVLLTQGNNARNTTLIATADGSGQIVITLRPSGGYGGIGPQDGAVLNGLAVTSVPNPDTDNDQLPDLWEYGYFPGDLTKLSGTGDQDADGATDLKEYQASTNPTDPDSDDDGLSDGAELNRTVAGNPAPTNPNSRDTDADGLFDNEETGTGIYGSASNTGSNPLVADSDGDGTKDHIEVLLGSNPNSAASLPSGHAAGPLVVLDAAALSEGALDSWQSTGLLARKFGSVSETKPQVTVKQGVKGVTLDGVQTSLLGPATPSILTGGSSRTVEAWIFNPSVANEETIISWGRRDGPDGTFSAFVHGTNAGYGAFAGWGPGPDVGWGSVPPKAGRWTHVAYTYDSATGALKVYADGALANQETMALNTWATDLAGNVLPIRLGAQNGGTGAMVGSQGTFTVARLRVHDRALSPSELQTGDGDSDGLPDVFEAFFGLNPASASDAALDPDGDGMSSLAEYRLGTSPTWANPDTDDDDLFDEWEITNFRDTLADPPESDAVVLAKQDDEGDPDLDGFSNRLEFLGGSNPNDIFSVPTDQDADNMTDAWEIQHFGSLAAEAFDDADGDGSFNIDEFIGDTSDISDWATDASDPKDEHSQPDTDGNGLGDGWELTHFAGLFNDPNANTDGDGLNNLAEYAALTDPDNADTDGDELSDSVEVGRTVGGNPAPTNPRSKDTDKDGLSDKAESGTGIYVNRSNTGSDPLDSDSDNDTHSDGLEVARGSNPNSAVSLPPAYSLMARWGFNETSGTTAASLPDATLSADFDNHLGEAVSLAWQASSGIGGALVRSNSADRLKTPAMDLSYGFTAMGWIKPGAEAQPTWARLILSRFQDGFFIGRDAGTNNWRFIVNNNFSLTGGTIASDVWQHVCATYDGTTARLYVDGVEVGSAPMGPPSVPVQPIFFGAEGGVDRAFTGQMDEFKIYSGALPAVEVGNIHTQEAAQIGAGSPYDLWAQSFGLNPAGNGAASADPDGDATSNQVEYALGLSPVDGRSRFAATMTGSLATGITLTWPSKPGLSFQVRSGIGLSSFPTLDATVPAAASPATTTSWSSGPLTPGKHFYRVEFTP